MYLIVSLYYIGNYFDPNINLFSGTKHVLQVVQLNCLENWIGGYA